MAVFGGRIIIRKFSQSRLPLAESTRCETSSICTCFTAIYRVSTSSSVGSYWKEIKLLCATFSQEFGETNFCCSTLFSGLWLILRDLCIRQELSLIMSRLILPLDMYRSINLCRLLDQWSFYKKRHSTA